MANKKEVEKRYLDAFLHSRPELQVGPVVCDEEPDFLLQGDSRQVGIEVTDFTTEQQKGESPPHEQYSLQQRVVQDAAICHRAAGGPPLDVQVIFRSDSRLSKRTVPQLARSLADLLLASTKGLSLWQQTRLDDNSIGVLPPEVQELLTLRVPTHEHGVWFAFQGGWAGHAGKDDITRIVAMKEPKVPMYRKKCEELWLLIVFRPLAETIFLRPPIAPLAFAIETSFDRVFCVEPFGPKSLEVPVVTRHP